MQLAKVIAAEKLNKYGSNCQRFIAPREAKAPTKRKWATTDVGEAIDTNIDNGTFAISISKGGCDDDSLDSDSNGIEIRNEEVCTQ